MSDALGKATFVWCAAAFLGWLGVDRYGHTVPALDPADVDRLLVALAEILDHGRIEHSYTRLLLVAPPRFLGQLNHALGDQVAKLVVKTISKDYSRADAAEIKAMLDAHD